MAKENSIYSKYSNLYNNMYIHYLSLNIVYRAAQY